MKFDMLWLDFLLDDSDSSRNLIKVLEKQGISYVRKQGSRSPYIPITGDWESYFNSRSKNFRHKLRKTKRKFERVKNYEIQKYTEHNISEAMREVLAISKKTWKYKAKTAIASCKENINFYTSLAEYALRKKWLQLWVLKIDNNLIAFTYDLLFQNTVFSLKSGYDLDYAKFSPSEFLNSQSIKECFENGISQYDWLGSNLPHKMKWTSFCKNHSKFWIFRNTPLGRLLFFLESNIIPFLKKAMFR